MTFSFLKKSAPSSASAEVVKDHLVLSLPHALEPIVWRMALDKIGTAAFEVKQKAKTTHYILVLKPKSGAVEIIAPFETKEGAVEALISASTALQQGESVPSQKNKRDPQSKIDKTETRNKSKSQNWAIAVLGAIIVLGLFYYLTTLIPTEISPSSINNSASNIVNTPQDTTGVPVSADDFLNGL